jgi:20S proteasome subunit beta 5
VLPQANQQGYSYDLSDEEAQELGRRSIVAAGHRDAFSGNTCNLYHVRENGWEFIGMFLSISNMNGADKVDNYDISELWYQYEEKKKAEREAAQSRGEPINVEG